MQMFAIDNPLTLKGQGHTNVWQELVTMTAVLKYKPYIRQKSYGQY